MILISRTISKIIFLLGIFLPTFALAQTSLSLSVSPTLFEMTANPTQEWESNIRVINSNPYEITVYTDVVNFAPQGESGQSVFLPINQSEANGQTLAEWIDIERQELVIPPEQTLEIPFSIKVPEGAPPGGHYSAVLVGTRNPEDNDNQSKLETSQVVTSLIFLRVTGDVNEDGQIREFRALKSLVETPEMDFELRFQNKGNVHILPQGEIRIFNMWGQPRGVIPVNKQSLYGNVLPEQIRKYTYSWKGEWSITDIGRYTADVTLAYGNEGRQFSNSETSFWVLPWKIVLAVIIAIAVFVYTVTWSIRLYIKKMLSMAGVAPDGSYVSVEKLPRKKLSVAAPIEEGMLDLRTRLNESGSILQKFSGLVAYVKQYSTFFIILLFIIIFLSFVVAYIRGASVDERGYEITIDPDGSNVTVTSEEIEYQELRNETSPELVPTNKNFPTIKLVNRSGINGLAAKLRVELETKGYDISSLSSDFNVEDQNTVIVYHPDYAEQALELSLDINNALLSSYEGASESEPIVVYVGRDHSGGVE